MVSGPAVPWPSIRADNRNSACSKYPGPSKGKLVWTHGGGERAYHPPLVGPSGEVLFAHPAGITCLTSRGENKWEFETEPYCGPGVPTLSPRGELVCTFGKEGLVIMNLKGESRTVDIDPCLCSMSAPLITDNGDLYLLSNYVSPNGQVLSGFFAFSYDGTLLHRASAGPSHHPAMSSDGLIFAKTESRYSSPDDSTECTDKLTVFSQEGKLIDCRRSGGYAAAGDCWGSNLWGGNCLAACFEDGACAVGIGRDLHVGDKAWPVVGHGHLALAPDERIITGTENGIYCYDREGKVLWTHPAIGASPVVDCEGKAYFFDGEETVHCLGREGDPLWKWALPDAGERPSSRRFNGMSIGLDGVLFLSIGECIFALS